MLKFPKFHFYFANKTVIETRLELGSISLQILKGKVGWERVLQEFLEDLKQKLEENSARERVRGRVHERERYDRKRGGKLLTTKYSEREIRVTKRESGEIIQPAFTGKCDMLVVEGKY